MKNSMKEKTFEKILNNIRKIRWNKIAVNDLLNFFIIITILVCNT